VLKTRCARRRGGNSGRLREATRRCSPALNAHAPLDALEQRPRSRRRERAAAAETIAASQTARRRRGGIGRRGWNSGARGKFEDAIDNLKTSFEALLKPTTS
jgi:hypothetical protein